MKNYKNISGKMSWIDRDIKRFKEIGVIIPNGQRKIYEKIRDFWAKGKSVIDVGCSIGLGSNILSQKAKSVLGIDINADSIKFARQAFGRPNLKFDVVNIEKPLSKFSKFSVVVCIEIIEHLEDYRQGIKNIKKFFLPAGEGVGFITLPNILNPLVLKRDADNKLHLQHWTPAEFYGLMKKNFRVVRLYSLEKLIKWDKKEMVGVKNKDTLLIARVSNSI